MHRYSQTMLTDCAAAADVAASVAVAVAARQVLKATQGRRPNCWVIIPGTHMLMRGTNKAERKGIRERERERKSGKRERRRGEQELRFGNRVGCVLFDSHTQIVNRLKLNAA